MGGRGLDRATVAVVGAGVSGLTAAYLLRRSHDVTLYEAQARLGGHAHTHDMTDDAGVGHAVDTGFIVHNDRTYPHLRRLFAELGVQTRPTEMSMSIRCEECGLEYAGGRGLRGILAQAPRVLANTDFLRMLLQVKRFHRRAARFLAAGDDATSYGQFLQQEGFGEHFVSHYAVPLVACVWSSGQETALLYPAGYLFRFLDHHGMLRVKGSPQWFTVDGGSRTYVERIQALLGDVRVDRQVTDIARRPDGVDITDQSGAVATYDKVVIATHADQALALLADPTDAEVSTLKAFTYSPNLTVLHTDPSLLPRAGQAKASWNYLRTSCTSLRDPTVVTYWMNRLQGLEASQDVLVTLNAADAIDPATVVATMRYEHPLYTAESVAAQARLATLTTDRTAYAGAYHGWGFHEDGCRAGVEAARAFGVSW
ncbi:MAG TPA: FAD-dependent oxidoreductase [Dermatophilaceae bacterium]|nr:FAD-dependent oxidoreductase [Dermatophilaceae bacterium]